jgi:hypothetical protein
MTHFLMLRTNSKKLQRAFRLLSALNKTNLNTLTMMAAVDMTFSISFFSNNLQRKNIIIISNMQTTPENSIPTISYHHKKISNKLMNTVPPRLMSETVQDIFNTFTFFDLNANQLIEINELRRILNALNFKKTNDECQDIINTYDLNNDHMIDFHEFIFALARLIKHDVFTLIDIQQRFK